MDKCFACGKILHEIKHSRAITIDSQVVFVGPECSKRIESAEREGYQPPLGGPKLYSLNFIELDDPAIAFFVSRLNKEVK